NLEAIGGWGLALHQVPGLLLGLLLYVILRRLRLRSLPWLAAAVYGGAVVLLLAVLLVGVQANGARRWLAAGGLAIQPSELAKLVAPFAERLLRPYQLARLQAFLSVSPGNHTELQAHIALSWGGWFGQARAPLHGLLALYLPARETDLAFVSLIEGWGLVAGA